MSVCLASCQTLTVWNLWSFYVYIGCNLDGVSLSGVEAVRHMQLTSVGCLVIQYLPGALVFGKRGSCF